MANHLFKPKPLEEIISPEARANRERVDWRGRPGAPKPLWAILGEKPPIGWRLEQEDTAAGQGGVAPVQLAQASASGTDAAGSPSDAVLVPLDVPGLGRTYVDPEIAPRVRDFIDRTRQAGIDVEFESGFRTTSGQTTLLDDPTATTPARPGNSLHEAGRAFDIKLHPRSANGKRIANQELRRIVEQARQAGFNWGGNFRTPDPGHFYIEVPEGIEHRGPRIQRAQEYYRQRLEDQ